MQPKNLDEVVEMLYRETDAYRKHHKVDENNIDEALPHHGYGTSVRNSLHLWWNESLVRSVYEKNPNSDYPKEKPPLVQWFNDLNIFHADDMSGTIQEALKAKIAGKPFDLHGHLKRYFKHWSKEGFKDGIFVIEPDIEFIKSEKIRKEKEYKDLLDNFHYE